VQQHFVSPKAAIDELEKKAKDCESRAQQESEPKASELLEEAKLYRTWIAAIRSGHWTA